MPWQPALGTQPLAPFDHQVAGQSSMLRYDKTTVCKPLIAREHFLYKTLPQELIEFTPEYRGEIEVQLTEEDGYIQLYGLCVGDEDDDDEVADDERPSTPIPGNHSHEPMDVRPKVVSRESSFKKNRSTIRVLRSGSYEVSPSTSEVFYAVDSNPDHPHTHSLNPWSLKNHKRLLDKMRKSEHTHNKIRFILLKNVVADFRHPSILDLKIGSRLHGDDASSVKVASQSEKCRRTTSSTLGVRLCGMQVYQVESSAYHSIDKYHGRTLNNESFREMLYNFLHNGTKFRSELIQPIVSRLSQLIDCLEKLHSFRFYASSLLVIYDGHVSLIPDRLEAKPKGSNADITIDMAPVEHFIEQQNSFQEKCHPGDHGHSSTDLCHPHCSKEACHPHCSKESCISHYSKESCHPPEDRACEHSQSSIEIVQSVRSPSKEHYCDFCSVCHAPPFSKNPDSQPQLGTSPAYVLDEFQTTPSTLPHQVTKLDQPTCRPLQKHLAHSDMLESGKPFYVSPQSSEAEETSRNLVVQQKQSHATRALASEVETTSVSLKNTSLQGSRQSEPQKLVLDLNTLSHTSPSSIYNVDSRLIHSEMKAVVLTRIKDQLPDKTVRDFKSDETDTCIQKDQEIFQLDSRYQDGSRKPQDTHSVDHHKPGSAELPEKRAVSLTEPRTSLQRQSSNSSTNGIKVDVKMIDFAHTTHEGFTADKIKHVGPDTDYIHGLRNLMELFQELQGRE